MKTRFVNYLNVFGSLSSEITLNRIVLMEENSKERNQLFSLKNFPFF